MSNAPRFSKDDYFFGRFPGFFARLSFWNKWHVDENEYGAQVK